MVDRATKYAKQVLSGNIVACKYVKLACQRHINDLQKSKKKDYPYKFDKELAEFHIDFFELLQHSKGKWAGQPVVLELWECFIIGNTYGWIHKKTGKRRFKESYNELGRKNGKSTLMSGVGLDGLTVDEEPGAEVYAAAVKKDQAKIVFDEARRMAKSSKALRNKIYIYTNNLNVPATNSKFEPLSSDVKSLDGLNTHIGIIDEYHAHPTSEVYDLIEGSIGSREQPLIFIITTAGYDIYSPCHEKHEYCLKILEGIIENERVFAYIATLDEDDDPFDESVWIKANPNLGVSKDLEYMRNKAKVALDLPRARDEFFTKQLNIWLRSETKWMDMKLWKRCNKALPDLKGKKCTVGIDLSATQDLTSVCFEFDLENGFYVSLVHSFMPEDLIAEKEKMDRVPYSEWIRQGWITPTPGNTVDYDWILSYIESRASIYEILEICVDPWNARQFTNNLAAEGFEIIEIAQKYKYLSPAVKDIEKLILEERIIHGNNPVLTWAVSNAIPSEDSNKNIKLDKKKSRQRIDPIVAFVTAHARVVLNPDSGKSIYEERGILTT